MNPPEKLRYGNSSHALICAYGESPTYVEFHRSNTSSKNISKVFIASGVIVAAASLMTSYVISGSIIVLTSVLGVALTLTAGLGIVVALCALVALARFHSRHMEVRSLLEIQQKQVSETSACHGKNIAKAKNATEIIRAFDEAIQSFDLTGLQLCLTGLPTSELQKLKGDHSRLFRLIDNGELWETEDRIKVRIEMLRELKAVGFDFPGPTTDRKSLLYHAVAHVREEVVDFLLEERSPEKDRSAASLANALSSHIVDEGPLMTLQEDVLTIREKIISSPHYDTNRAAIHGRIKAIDQKLKALKREPV